MWAALNYPLVSREVIARFCSEASTVTPWLASVAALTENVYLPLDHIRSDRGKQARLMADAWEFFMYNVTKLELQLICYLNKH